MGRFWFWYRMERSRSQSRITSAQRALRKLTK